ncbi:MAG: hypothetical protein AAGC70_12150 [Pseudomonadota bacterium]
MKVISQSKFAPTTSTTRALRAFIALGGVAGLAGLSVLYASFAEAQQPLSWTFAEAKDADNGGRMTARLRSNVPQTDYAQLAWTCDETIAQGEKVTALMIALDVGQLADGTPTKVRFSGGGLENVIDGKVKGANAEVGITGVVVRPRPDSPVWKALTTLGEVDVTIPGYLSTKINLEAGREKIRQFAATCLDYLRPRETASTPSADNTNASEKREARVAALSSSEAKAAPAPESASENAETERETFLKAREKGTVDAWQSFLSRYPTGFRADLARAYLRRLGVDAKSPSSPPSAPASPPLSADNAKPTPPPSTGPAKVAITAGETSWEIGQENIASDGGRIVDTASVEAGGARLLAHCSPSNGRPTLALMVRPIADGSNGDLIRRSLTQAAKAGQPIGRRGVRRISVTFNDGQTVRGASTYDSAVSDRGLQILTYGSPLDAKSQSVGRLIAGRSVTIASGPFSATFQLKGSQAALCSVLNACGVKRSDCAGVDGPGPVGVVTPSGLTPPSTDNSPSALTGEDDGTDTASPYAPPSADDNSTNDDARARVAPPPISIPRRTDCNRGRVYSKRRGRCVCPSSRPDWDGRRCRRLARIDPDDDDDGRPAQRVRCRGGQYYNRSRGRCVCPRGRRWTGRVCARRGGYARRDDDRPRRRSRDRGRPGETGICRQLRRNCQTGGREKTCKRYEDFCGQNL